MRTDQNTTLPMGNILQLSLDTSVYSEYISFQKLCFVAACVPAWLSVHMAAFPVLPYVLLLLFCHVSYFPISLAMAHPLSHLLTAHWSPAVAVSATRWQ